MRGLVAILVASATFIPASADADVGRFVGKYKWVKTESKVTPDGFINGDDVPLSMSISASGKVKIGMGISTEVSWYGKGTIDDSGAIEATGLQKEDDGSRSKVTFTGTVKCKKTGCTTSVLAKIAAKRYVIVTLSNDSRALTKLAKEEAADAAAIDARHKDDPPPADDDDRPARHSGGSSNTRSSGSSSSSASKPKGAAKGASCTSSTDCASRSCNLHADPNWAHIPLRDRVGKCQ